VSEAPGVYQERIRRFGGFFLIGNQISDLILCADQAGNDQLYDGEARGKSDGADLHARFSFVAGQ
jgi:hypothetical protein